MIATFLAEIGYFPHFYGIRINDTKNRIEHKSNVVKQPQFVFHLSNKRVIMLSTDFPFVYILSQQTRYALLQLANRGTYDDNSHDWE